MNDVQKFILNRAMQKVANKGMQKEANPIKNAWEKGTDWLANNLFLSNFEKKRRDTLKPDKPVTLSSDSMKVVGKYSDGSAAWGTDYMPIRERLRETSPIRYHDEKSRDVLQRIVDLEGKDNPFANLIRKYYEKQYDKHTDKVMELESILLDNLSTPYVEFRKQHPEFFKNK